MKEFVIKILKAFSPMPDIGIGERNRVVFERMYVASRSSGNVNLQIGRYLDAAAVRSIKEDVLKYDFSEI